MTPLTVIKKLVSSLRISAPVVCTVAYSPGSLSVGRVRSCHKKRPGGRTKLIGGARRAQLAARIPSLRSRRLRCGACLPRCLASGRCPNPALVRLIGQAVLGSIDPTGELVVLSLGSLRVDVLTADADRRRAEEAQPSCSVRVWHLHEPQLCLDADLPADSLDECASALEVRAVVG